MATDAIIVIDDRGGIRVFNADMTLGLARVGTFLEMDRVTLLELTDDRTAMTVAYSWSHQDVVAPPPLLTQQMQPWWLTQVLRGEASLASDVDDLPKEAVAEKEYLRELDKPVDCDRRRSEDRCARIPSRPGANRFHEQAGGRQTLTAAIDQLRVAGGSKQSPHVDAVRPTRAVWPTALPRARSDRPLEPAAV